MDKDLDFAACEIGADAFQIIQEILAGTGSRARISQLTGISEGALKDYFTGRTSPTLDRFLLIALAAERDPASFFGAPPKVKSERADQVLVPVLDVRAAVGDGQHPDLVQIEEEWPFPRDWLRALARGPSRPECIQVAGDSMDPTIRDGSRVIIDRAQVEVAVARRTKAPAGVWCFVADGVLRLKRLRRMPDGAVVIFGDNPAWQPEVWRPGEGRELTILGRAIWVGNPL